jgi:O-antigen/teichoic acid export membrane protein
MDEAPPETLLGAGEPELGFLVRRGLRWSFAGTIAVRLGTFVSGLVMARLLSPADFGIYAVGAVALLVTASVNDIGIEPTLVRWTGNLEEVAPTAMTIVMISSVGLFGIFWLMAPAFADALGAPNGTGVVRLMSVGLIISGAFTVNSAVNTRLFRQHVRAVAEISALVVTIGLGVILALSGAGAYSLAWGQIAGNVVVGIVLFVGSPVRFRPGFHLPAAKQLIRLGLPLAGAGLLVIAVLNVDYVMVGSLLGAASLGLYLLAWNLSSWPVNLFSAGIHTVSVAGFARLQHDHEALERGFRQSFSAIITATLPVCALLGTLALPLIRILYGEKWVDASVALQFLAAIAAVRVASLLATNLLVACGWGKTTFLVQAAWLVALVPTLWLGAEWYGIEGVAAGHLVAALGVALPAYLIVLHRKNFAIMPLARVAVRPLLGTVLVVVVGAGAAHLPASDIVRVVVATILGLSAYALVTHPIWLPALTERRRARLDRAAT